MQIEALQFRLGSKVIRERNQLWHAVCSKIQQMNFHVQFNYYIYTVYIQPFYSTIQPLYIYMQVKAQRVEHTETPSGIHR